MDPTTLALLIAAALAAFGIKRGARRPPPVEPPALGPEAYQQVSVLPNRLDGGGLRPAVTEKDKGDEGDEGEGIGDLPGLTVVQGQRGLITAATAIRSGSRADTVGAASTQYGHGGSQLSGGGGWIDPKSGGDNLTQIGGNFKPRGFVLQRGTKTGGQ
jgi:hypothetical protein